MLRYVCKKKERFEQENFERMQYYVKTLGGTEIDGRFENSFMLRMRLVVR